MRYSAALNPLSELVRFDAQGHCRLRDDVLRHVDFGCLSGRDGQCGGGGEASRREGVYQYVADDALTDEHYRNHREPAAQATLARRASAELVRSAGRARPSSSCSAIASHANHSLSIRLLFFATFSEAVHYAG